jgi:uncharacterized protein
MNMQVMRFGSSEREIVGVYQTPTGAAVEKPACLLCRPVGQEGTRSAAMFRVLADRLARDGCRVMRFDYHGTGDSPGAEAHQTLTSWVSDAAAAHRQLLANGASRTVWFGLGLGANIALLAAQRCSYPPSNLVLWEPVLNGREYMERLLSSHRAELAREYGYPWKRLIDQQRATEPAFPGDVLGFAFGPALAMELADLALDVRPALRRGIQLSGALRQEDAEHLSSLNDGAGVKFSIVKTPVDWMSSQAMGAAVAPSDAVQTLMNALG